MKIAITGATGQLGHLAVNNLKEKASADNIIALVRSLEKQQNWVWKQEKLITISLKHLIAQ